MESGRNVTVGFVDCWRTLRGSVKSSKASHTARRSGPAMDGHFAVHGRGVQNYN